ncbi:MAG: DUF935 domain-containing protein [bacterium]
MGGKKGFYITPTEFVQISDGIKSLSQEISTRSASLDYSSLAGALPNPDVVLRKAGLRMTVYKELLTDTSVQAAYSSRKGGVKSKKWDIRWDNEKGLSILTEMLKQLKINNIIDQILEAVFYGFKPLEIMWEYQNGLILPAKIIGKPVEWFIFNTEGQMRFLSKTSGNEGIELPNMKFLVPVNNGSYENPYGFATLSTCFWPVTFKKGGLKFWVTFAEKYGMPWAIGKVPRSTSSEARHEMANSLENMIADGIAVINDDGAIELKESGNKSTSTEVYKELVSEMRKEIALGLLGQTLTSDVGSTGSFAASKTHEDVRQDLIDSDKGLVEETINTLLTWITDLNFGNEKGYPEFYLYNEEDVDKVLAERDQILTQTGVKFTKTYYMRAYGLTEDEFEIASRDLFDFAESDKTDTLKKDEIDSASGLFTPEEQQNLIEKIMQPVINAIMKGNSYEEITEKIAELMPDMHTDDLENILQKAFFAAETFGRTEKTK